MIFEPQKRLAMTKKSEVSITDRIVAAALHKEVMSLKQIVERISRSVSTVSDVIRRFKATEQFENSPRSGRPKISTAREDRKLIRLSRKNRTASSPLLSTHWALTSGKLPSSRTVRRRLQEAGYEWTLLLFQLFNGRLNQHSYIEILEKNLVASKKKLKMPNSFIFQQDNAPCHRAKSVANWMKRRKVKTLQWPPNSPDLNPIENLWSWLDGQLAKEILNTLQDLMAAINRILSNVPNQLIKNLVESMPNRIHEYLKAHGGITRY